MFLDSTPAKKAACDCTGCPTYPVNGVVLFRSEELLLPSRLGCQAMCLYKRLVSSSPFSRAPRSTKKEKETAPPCTQHSRPLSPAPVSGWWREPGALAISARELAGPRQIDGRRDQERGTVLAPSNWLRALKGRDHQVVEGSNEPYMFSFEEHLIVHHRPLLAVALYSSLP